MSDDDPALVRARASVSSLTFSVNKERRLSDGRTNSDSSASVFVSDSSPEFPEFDRRRLNYRYGSRRRYAMTR